MKTCKICNSTESKKWYSGPKCKQCYHKEWRLKNKEKYQKQYYIENKSKELARTSEYSKNNREKINKRRREWYAKNKHTMKDRSTYHKEYFRNRYQNDIEFKIKVNLRNRLNNAIKNGQKTGSAIKDLGCSVEELRTYLEKHFQEGMTWDNYGEWHIDHIKPLDSFKLENREELLKACNYKNLQPLWAEDNFKKSNST